MKYLFIVLLAILLYTVDSFSVIYRHDVDSTKYIELGQSPDFNFVGRTFKIKDPNGTYPNLENIRYKNKNYISNGTCQLISKNWVISAAHLFEIAKTKPVEYEYKGKKVKSHEVLGKYPDKKENYIFQFGDDIYEADTIIYHQKYFDTWKSGYYSMYDVALIKLKRPIRNIIPVKIYKDSNEVGLKGYCVGYGANGDAYISNPYKSRKLAGENIIDTLYTSRDGVESILALDFDMADNDDCNKLGSAIPLDLECTTTGGDSGSGFISKLNDNFYLVGISPSGGVNLEQMEKTGYYCHTSQYVRTSIIRDWIYDFTGVK